MANFLSDKIKNVAIAGHGGSGKTTLCEALLFKSGCIDRMGKIEEGTTWCDYDAEEIKRKASVNMTVAPIKIGDNKINLIDTPGMFDFSAGLVEGVKASESVIICVSGKSGVTYGAKKAFKLADKEKKAKMIFVSKLDSKSANFYNVLEQLKAEFGPSVCPIVVPHYKEHFVESYIDLIDMKAYQYNDMGGKMEIEVPYEGHRTEGLKNAIGEAVAETDEALFEKFFSGEEFTNEEIRYGIKKGIREGTLVPVLCGSPQTLTGIDLLAEAIEKLLPSAEEALHPVASVGGEDKEIIPDEKGKTVAFVYRTLSDPFVGKLSYVKVLSGTLSSDQTLINSRTGEEERVGKIVFVSGKTQSDTSSAPAGDICAIAKMSAETGDTLCDKSFVVSVPATEYEAPSLTRALKVAGKGDESKIAASVMKLLSEDKTLSFAIHPETKEMLLSGTGEQHLECTVSKLKGRYGVDVLMTEPIIPYRETITSKVKVQGRYKKQSGGHGQYGDVWIEFEPTDSDGLVFEEKVVGGAVPKGYFPAVEKGLEDSIKHGVKAGYPVVGLKATLVDGSYHPVDSSEMAFKTAASLAYKEGMVKAGPIILEPIGTLVASVPDDKTGDIIGEVNKRRGRMLGMDPGEKGYQCITAEVPMSEMGDFSITLRAITGGSGSFTFEEARYERLPSMLEEKVISSSKSWEN